jgi:hypothetical protein
MCTGSTVHALCTGSTVRALCTGSTVRALCTGSTVRALCTGSTVRALCIGSTVHALCTGSTVRALCIGSTIHALCTSSTHTLWSVFATSKDKQNARFLQCLLISVCTTAVAPWDSAWNCLPNLAQLLTCLYRTLITNFVYTKSLL